MGPKKPKDVTLDENYWRIAIESAPLNEETWTVKVVMIEAAGSDQDRMYLNKFEVFAAEERRFVIKNICKTETIFMVNQLGGEKKVKDDNLRIFEEGQAFLKDKKDIPPDILALIIKNLILKMKDEYLFIRRQKLEVKKGISRESSTMINKAEVRGTVNVNPPEEMNLSAIPPKDKSKNDEIEPAPEVPENKKYNTLLRMRGEEWRDKIYVDDFPIDGPNLYIAITGFLEPHLAESLLKIGVEITAVVQVRIDSTSIRVPSSLFRTSKRGQSQTDVLTAKCQKFWEDLQQLRIDKNSCDDYKNTAFIVFTPPYRDTEDLSGNPEKIYDELCYLMYDIQDLTRQHNHYLENMDVIDIPQERGVLYEQYQKKYNEHISDLPLECVSTYSVLDSILQVVCSSQQYENSSNTSLSTALTINQTQQSDINNFQKAQNLVRDVFDNLCKGDSTKNKYRITYGEEYENLRDPIVIHYGDIAKYKIFHLGNINMDNVIWSMLHGVPIFKLWQYRDTQSEELEAKINFHVNVLLSCFERKDVEPEELSRLIHILACRKMYNNRSSLKIQHLPLSTIPEFKKVFLKRSVLAEPLPISSLYKSWSSLSPPCAVEIKNDNDSNNLNGSFENYRIRFLFDCPDISELISAAEIACEKPLNHMINDYDFFEYFSNVSGSQAMVNAFKTFNCVDYKYCEVTDSIILMFFNSHDKDGVARDEWRCHLPTPLCLQDFFDFVLEEHYEWIKNEEQIYADNIIQRTQSEYKNCSNILARKTCIENTEVSVDLLMEGSLKHREFTNIEEVCAEDTEVKTKTTSMSSTDVLTSKSSKKTKSAVSTPKNVKQTFVRSDSNSSEHLPKKPFSGYNLSDRRVEIFGKDSTYFSKDGTVVSTKYTIMIPENSENITLRVAPGNNNTEFWMQRTFDDVEGHISDKCDSFRVSTKDTLIIYLKKESLLVHPPTLDPICAEQLTEKDKVTKSSPDDSSKVQETENKSFYSLKVTWPNGLITESVYENNSDQISHIKQYYITPALNLDEDMRCINLKGEVILFKTSGLIEILRSDGSYISINKYEKKIVNQDVHEEQSHSDASSDKSKKGKGKDKNKPSKASSKSSKNIIDNDEKISDIKEPEYELFFNEFEITEPNGLKQKFENDNTLLYTKKQLIRTTTNYCSEEIFSRRMDGTNILLNKDGIQIVTFPDNTRIITTFIVEDNEIFPEWTDEEIEYFTMFDFDTIETDTIKSKQSSQQSYKEIHKQSTSLPSSTFKRVCEEENDNDNDDELKMKVRTDGYISIHIVFTIEHKKFSTVTLNKFDGTICVTSPNNVSVTITPNNKYNFTLDNLTAATFDGEDLNINYKSCSHCQSHTSCSVRINHEDISNAINEYWLKMKDSFGQQITVNNEGNINIVEDSLSDNVTPEEEPCISDTSQLKCSCKQLNEARAMNFFILKRDLTCLELVHRALVDQYKRTECRSQPWCTMKQYDTFGDNRSILSITTPIHLTETEKWIMESQFSDKPKYLTYQDLNNDSVKGYYHWMRPYKRFQPTYTKPENAIPERLPRAFVLRTLEQQWSESRREKLNGGKELLTAILRYRRVMESNSDTILHVPIREPPEDERRVHDLIQAIAHRTFEDLKCHLGEDIQKRAKPTITTKPPSRSEDLSLDGELEEIPSAMDILEEKRESTIREVEAVYDTSDTLKRYWRRRAEELKEEEFYKYLLREGSVPPYFRNILGGAIWWEMNNVTDEAVTKSERRKMKCVCEEHGESSSHGNSATHVPGTPQ